MDGKKNPDHMKLLHTKFHQILKTLFFGLKWAKDDRCQNFYF